MVDIDSIIDDQPTAKKIRDLAELRNRNHQAFEELQSYNDTGEFKYKHPLIIHYSLRSELLKLKKNNPDKFLEEYANTRDNVKRYTSFLNNKKRSDDQKAKDKENLKKHQIKESVFKEVFNNE
jgi:hypothetical protein